MSKSSSGRDTVLSINVVEPALVRAVKLLSKDMGQELKGLSLVHSGYASFADRPKDTTGLFKEIVCDFDNPDELQSVLKPYTDSLLAVTCRMEEAIQPFAQVIPFLPYLYTPSESALLWSTEKPLMRDRLSNYDRNLVPKYQYMEETDLPQLRELLKDFTFPLITKPSGLSQALLVNRNDSLEELEKCLKDTFKVIGEVYERENSPGKPGILVEEMMQGDLYSVDAYVTHHGEIFCLPLVKVITAYSLGLPGFYTYRTIVPTGLPETEVEAAFAVCRSAIRALNLSSTTTHIELFHTAEGWKVIELGARIGGHRNDLYREAYGVEHYYNDLLVRMGKKPIMPGKPLRYAAGSCIYADEEGPIEAIEGLEEARQLASVVFVEPHAKPGDMALFAGNGGALVVDCTLSNEDPEQLEKDVAKVRELVKIRVRKEGTPPSATFLQKPKNNLSTSRKTAKTQLNVAVHHHANH